MKTWLKGGLIGAGILVLVLFLFIGSSKLFYAPSHPTSAAGLDDWSIIIIPVFIAILAIVGFIIGAIIGLIIGKIKSRRET